MIHLKLHRDVIEVNLPIVMPYLTAGNWQFGLSRRLERTRFNYPLSWRELPIPQPVMRYWQTGPFVIRYFPELPPRVDPA